ncbi:MAG: hypothetical protein ACTSXG_02335, partial [Alphaproteobacteria bacterium]
MYKSYILYKGLSFKILILLLQLTHPFSVHATDNQNAEQNVSKTLNIYKHQKQNFWPNIAKLRDILKNHFFSIQQTFLKNTEFFTTSSISDETKTKQLQGKLSQEISKNQQLIKTNETLKGTISQLEYKIEQLRLQQQQVKHEISTEKPKEIANKGETIFEKDKNQITFVQNSNDRKQKSTINKKYGRLKLPAKKRKFVHIAWRNPNSITQDVIQKKFDLLPKGTIKRLTNHGTSLMEELIEAFEKNPIQFIGTSFIKEIKEKESIAQNASHNFSIVVNFFKKMQENAQDIKESIVILKKQIEKNANKEIKELKFLYYSLKNEIELFDTRVQKIQKTNIIKSREQNFKLTSNIDYLNKEAIKLKEENQNQYDYTCQLYKDVSSKQDLEEKLKIHKNTTQKQQNIIKTQYHNIEMLDQELYDQNGKNKELIRINNLLTKKVEEDEEYYKQEIFWKEQGYIERLNATENECMKYFDENDLLTKKIEELQNEKQGYVVQLKEMEEEYENQRNWNIYPQLSNSPNRNPLSVMSSNSQDNDGKFENQNKQRKFTNKKVNPDKENWTPLKSNF